MLITPAFCFAHGAPGRPRLRLLGCRFANASYTAATICSSASTWSACVIQSSRRSLTSSAINPSPKLSCARRILITALPPALPALCRGSLRTQQIVVELADRLDRLLELLIIVEPAANLGNPFAAHADLPGSSAGVAHRQHEDLVPFAARAFRAIFGMSDSTLQQRATQDLAADRQFADKLLARSECLRAIHP